VRSFITTVLVVLLDQVTKLAIVKNLAILDRIPVWGSVLRITHIRNSGAVFGMMKGAGAYFTFFSIVAAGVLIVVLFFSRKASTAVKTALGLVLGGAIGNLIDRLRFGSVVDFVDIGVSETTRWPCFNVADMAITIGVILLVVKSLRSPGRHIIE
jgi:signal peptidase II